MTRRIWIIGEGVAGLITAFRLLPYGFDIRFLHRTTSKTLTDAIEVFPPVWPGFFQATWSLLKEMESFIRFQEFPSGPLETCSFETFHRQRFRQWPLRSQFHLIPEILGFSGLPWRDRWQLLNILERQWEEGNTHDAIPDTQTAKQWVRSAGQSEEAQRIFWNPLTRWLLGCNLEQASRRALQVLLTAYAKATGPGTQLFFGPPLTLHTIKTALQSCLRHQGVQFFNLEHPALLTIKPGTEERFSLSGGAFSSSDLYVLALTPEEIIPLLPERSLAKYAQLQDLAKLPAFQPLILQFSVPGMRSNPSFVLCPRAMDFLVIHPQDPTNRSSTHVTCCLAPSTECSSDPAHPALEPLWRLLQRVLHLPPDLSITACAPTLISSNLRIFPALAGTRSFHPQPATPVPNLFLVGTWTTTAFPHSMESLITSANHCAGAIARRTFLDLH